MQSRKSLLWEVACVSRECSEAWASAGFHLGLRDGHSLRVQKTEHGQHRNKYSARSLVHPPRRSRCLWRLCRRLMSWWERPAHSLDHSNTSVNVSVSKDDHKDELLLPYARLSSLVTAMRRPAESLQSYTFSVPWDSFWFPLQLCSIEGHFLAESTQLWRTIPCRCV